MPFSFLPIVSVPEWLGIRYLARSLDCIGQDRRRLGVLSARQQSNGECLFGLVRNSALGVSKSVRELAVDLHVVEPAEAGLNSFKSGGEHFAAAFNLATLIHALEELARITNFFDGDAKLVAAARVKALPVSSTA